MRRQTRNDLTSLFIGLRDGYLAAKLGGQKVFGGRGLPDYAIDDDAGPAEKTGEDLFRDFAYLVTERTH